MRKDNLRDPIHGHLAHNDGRAIEHINNVERAKEQAARTDRTNKGPIDPRLSTRPKTQASIPIHGAMHRNVGGEIVPGSGTTASYLDSVSGATVPAGKITAPGWGDGTSRSGNPMAHAPASKVLRQVAPSWGNTGSKERGSVDLGEAVLREALRSK